MKVSSSPKLDILRDSKRVGSISLDSLYCPVLRPDGTISIPPKRASILTTKIGGKCYELSSQHARKEIWKVIYHSFKRWLNLPDRIIDTMRNGSLSRIHLVENTIHCLMNSFMFSFPELLLEPKFLKQVIRKCFKIGVYSIDNLVAQIKAMKNYLYVLLFEIETLEENIPPVNNFLKCILKYVERLKTYEKDREFCSRVYNLVYTRDMPPGGAYNTKKALLKFEQIVTRKHHVTLELLLEARQAAVELGAMFKAGNPDYDYNQSAHISVSNAGDPVYGRAQGGRPEAMLEDILPILLSKPEKTGTTEVFPGFWYLADTKGAERWRTWCRYNPLTFTQIFSDEEEQEFMPQDEFGSEYEVRLPFGNVQGFLGHDGALGQQILACAIITGRESLESGAYSCRVSTLPESGGKVRIATTSPWWVLASMQGPGHVLRDMLKWFPECTDGLTRGQQAWNIMNALRGDVKGRHLISDLESATDALSRDVLKSMYDGFLEGAGINNPFFQWASRLAFADKIITLPCKRTFVATSGVLMGEPMTKGLLTLYNLVIGQIAARRCSFPPRIFRIGGDDHFAIGPDNYLKSITQVHMELGSLISKSKHGIPAIAGKYCEGLLYFKSYDRSIKTWTLSKQPDKIANCIFVDTLKLKLLSPYGSRVFDSDEKNQAIGKARELTKFLSWSTFPVTGFFFSKEWKALVRDRFINLMGSYIPGRYKGDGTENPAYWQLMLPPQWGGLGLGMPHEYKSIIKAAPHVTKFTIAGVFNAFYEGKNFLLSGFYPLTRCVQSFCSPTSMRGVRNEVRMVEEFLMKILSSESTEVSTWSALKALPDFSHITQQWRIAKELNAMGWYNYHSLSTLLNRSSTFVHLLLGAEPVSFSTTPWSERLRELENALPPVDDFDVDWDFIIQRHPDLQFLEDPWIRVDIPVDGIFPLGKEFDLLPSGDKLTFVDVLQFCQPSLKVRLDTEPVRIVPKGTRFIPKVMDLIQGAFPMKDVNPRMSDDDLLDEPYEDSDDSFDLM